MSLRRLVPLIFINVVVSATVVLLVLVWWDNRQDETEAENAEATNVSVEWTPIATGNSEADASRVPAEEGTATIEEAGDEGGPTIHTVQAGETLGRISAQYDVPVEEIAAANNIGNINSISVGQELIIPIGGLATETPPPPTPEPTAEPTPDVSPTPLATEPPLEGTVVVEITEVIGLGDLTSEAVRISNSGTRPIALRGWEILDEDNNVYAFVDVTLYGSSEAGTPSILIHTEAGQNGPSDLFWGLEAAVWESGETVTVKDAEGTTQATYVIP